MLQRPTDPAWIRLAMSRLDQLLIDHAHCEKKAAAHALSMLAAFHDTPGLPRAMARLAREEAGHLSQVLAILDKRGLKLGRDPGDPYAQALLKLVRNPPHERLLDQLLVSALIEDRSRERLDLLAQHLQDPELRDFYARLAAAEAGHGSLFLRLAKKVAPESFQARLDSLAAAEARIIETLPIRAAIH